jgi:PTS system cellobiose-specific IIB component
MKNIVLICAAGMSTSLLVSKMEKAALEEGYDCKIQAYAVNDAPTVIPGSDVVLLGPQVRFNLKAFRAQFPDKKIELIDMIQYGTMNGKAVFDFAKKIIG